MPFNLFGSSIWQFQLRDHLGELCKKQPVEKVIKLKGLLGARKLACGYLCFIASPIDHLRCKM